jgi:ankyrin repeat protein
MADNPLRGLDISLQKMQRDSDSEDDEELDEFQRDERRERKKKFEEYKPYEGWKPSVTGQRFLDQLQKMSPEQVARECKMHPSVVNYQNDGGVSPLWSCAWHIGTKQAEVLLRHGAKVDLTDRTQQTPLILAAGTGSRDMVSLLLKNGAYVNAVTDTGLCALHSGLKYAPVVKLLLDAGANREIKLNGQTALQHAREIGNMASSSLALLHEADQFDLLKKVAERRAATPADMQKLLKDCQDMYEACRKGDFDALSKLLDGGADVTHSHEKKRSPLWVACRHGKANCARLLLQHNALVDQVDEEGVTPLITACANGKLECAEVCIHAGARLNAINHKEFTPLLSAVYNRHVNIALMLLEKDARIDAKVNGKDALDWARLVVKAAPNEERKALVAKLEGLVKKEVEAQQEVSGLMSRAVGANRLNGTPWA